MWTWLHKQMGWGPKSDARGQAFEQQYFSPTFVNTGPGVQVKRTLDRVAPMTIIPAISVVTNNIAAGGQNVIDPISLQDLTSNNVGPFGAFGNV